jgi:hypothetical protein
MNELLQNDSINQTEITDTKQVKIIWLGIRPAFGTPHQ